MIDAFLSVGNYYNGLYLFKSYQGLSASQWSLASTHHLYTMRLRHVEGMFWVTGVTLGQHAEQ